MVTIKDVARRARVGVATVSRVFNEHPDVSVETRQKVLTIAKRLRYRPHSGARQLVRARTETICFVLSNRAVISPFHSHILVGVEEYARKLSYHVIFLRFDYSAETPGEDLALPSAIWERGAVDGVVLAGTNYLNFVGAVRHLGVPFVLLGNNLIGETPVEDVNTIWFDSRSGTCLGTKYLIELGHRDIWFLGDTRWPWYRRCCEGYLNAMNENGLAPRKLDPEMEGSTFDYGFRLAERVLELDDRATALVAGDDEIALGVLTALNRRGVKVPEDISLLGSDDIEEIKYLHPPLTTVRVPKEIVGEDLAKLLFERLENPGLAAIQRVIPTELVVRESCAPPRTALGGE